MNELDSITDVVPMLEMSGFVYLREQHGRHVFYNHNLNTECVIIAPNNVEGVKIESESAWNLLQASGFTHDGIRFGVHTCYRESPQTLITIYIDEGILSTAKTRHLFKSIFGHLYD